MIMNKGLAMNLFDIYVVLIRGLLIILTGYHLYKRQYKKITGAALAFLLTFVPDFLRNAFNIGMDLTGSCLFVTIILMTAYLGNSLKFYDRYAWWDMLIHFLSGIVFVSIAIALSKKSENLEKIHALFFCFTYSLSHHALWEVAEYISDCLFHTDNQRWQKVNASNNHAPESAIQPAGLVDTMNDTIICAAGTISACAVWWFIL